MSAQPNLIFAQHSASSPAPGPHPVSLETIGLIVQALAELLSSLRRQTGSDAADSAGAIEYASWLRRER